MTRIAPPRIGGARVKGNGARLRLLAGLILACAALVGVAAAPAEAPTGDAEELERVLAELRDLRRGFYGDRRALEAQIDGMRVAITRLEAEVGTLDEQRVELETEQRAAKAAVTELNGALETARAERKAIVDACVRFAAAERGPVESGLPVRLDRRLGRLDVVRDATTGAEAFGGAWSFFQEELRLARSGEMLGDRAKLPDGREKNARMVRVGHHFLGLVTEDGADVALWVPGEGWVTDPTRVHPEAVRTAVDIFDRRRVPTLVRLPLRLERTAEGR